MNQRERRGAANRYVGVFCALGLLCSLAFATQKQSSRSKPAPRPEPPDVVELSADPAFHQAFANDRVQVFRLELAPQASTQLNRHDRDYLLLALTSARLEATDGAHTNNLAVEPEAMQVMKGGWPHRIVNLGDAPAAAVIIVPTAKLDPEHAICGLAARQCRTGEIGDELGKYTESVLFETATAKLTQAEVAPGAQIPPTDYTNPVLIVATTEASLADIRSVIATSTGADQQDNATPRTSELQLKPGDTAFIPGGTTEALKNTGKEDARLVLLTLRPTE